MTLRTWKPEEADTYCSLRDELVFRFTTEDPSLGPPEARRRIQGAGDDPNVVPFAIRDTSGSPVGHLSVSRLGPRVEISYWLGPGARGRGLASQALRAATRWAFDHWGPDTVRLEIDPANDASIRVAERCGYRPAGTRLESSCGGPALLFDADAARPV